MTEKNTPANPPGQEQTSDTLDELDRIQQEVARRIADNRRFLEQFMDLDVDLDEDEMDEDGDGDEDVDGA